MQSEYASAGVAYRSINPFKRIMGQAGKRTLHFPWAREVSVRISEHGATYEYKGDLIHCWSSTQEGLGNKNWIAEWMYQNAGTSRTYYDGIGIDTAMMAVNDVIAQGAMPVVYLDEVASGASEWYEDEKRAKDLAESYYQACRMAGMALPAGESSALRYLVKAELPVAGAPVLSGCAIGIVAPKTRLITGEHLRAGDRIVGALSSGLHANGVSLVIKRALSLPEQFLAPVGTGRTLGEEALIPTRCYVRLVEALLKEEVEIHSLLPGTGSGVAKLAFDKRPFTYRINEWVDIPPIFEFMRELGVSLYDCLTTFNWGIGYYLFLPPEEAERAIAIGGRCGYELRDLGVVEEGKRQVIFGPACMLLPPPGE